MLVPGLLFSLGRVAITAGAGQVPDFINQGVGFMNDGSLAVDTDAPSSPAFDGGIAVSSAGAVHGTTTTAGTDVYIQGLRVSAVGQLVYEAADPAGYTNGNPFTTAGSFSTT